MRRGGAYVSVRIAGVLFRMRWPCVAVSGRRACEPSRGPEARVSVAWRAPRYRMRRGGAGLPALQGRCFGCVGPVSR